MTVMDNRLYANACHAREAIREALDNWPDAGELNLTFNKLTFAYDSLRTWIAQQEANAAQPATELTRHADVS